MQSPNSLPFHSDLAIGLAGGVIPLLILLRNGTDRQKAGAARALGHLGSEMVHREALAKNQGIESLLELMGGTAEEAARSTLQTISSFPDGSDCIVGPTLCFLRKGTDPQQAGAAWLLGELVQYSETRKKIVENKGIELLLELLDGTPAQKEAALNTLQRIASDPEGKNAIANANVTSRDVLVVRWAQQLGNPKFNRLVDERGGQWSKASLRNEERRALCGEVYDRLQGEYRRFLMVQDVPVISIDNSRIYGHGVYWREVHGDACINAIDTRFERYYGVRR